MQPGSWYKERVEKLDLDLKALHKRKSVFAWLRLATIIGIIAFSYFLWPAGLVYVLIPDLLLLVAFFRSVYADLKNKRAIEHNNYLVAINEAELKALEHHYYHFADGNELMPKEHYYANDL